LERGVDLQAGGEGEAHDDSWLGRLS
jgi:hypothetical protein